MTDSIYYDSNHYLIIIRATLILILGNGIIFTECMVLNPSTSNFSPTHFLFGIAHKMKSYFYGFFTCIKHVTHMKNGRVSIIPNLPFWLNFLGPLAFYLPLLFLS